MRYFVTLGGREIAVDVTPALNGWKVESEGRELSVDAVSIGGALSLRVDGRVFDLVLDGSAPQIAYALGRSRGGAPELGRSRGVAPELGPSRGVAPELGRSRGVAPELGRSRGVATIETARLRAAAPRVLRDARQGDVVVAPMPGRIVRVPAEVGHEVTKGAPLVVIEAMKMENELRSSRDGRVAEVLVQPGDTVERGARLVVLVG